VTAHGAARAEAILSFWFHTLDYDRGRKRWFGKDDAFDAEIRRRFEADHERAAAGAYDALAATADGALALVILLDQVPRNIHRGTARAFAADPQARNVAGRAVDAGFDRTLPPVRRIFLYLPFEHSEDLADQRRAVALFESLPTAPGFPDAARAETIDYARRHLDIVARFGRFPHRNAALGRPSTPEEARFLTEPGSSF
jgi:uncharacterized protein (DUF924 family)